MTMLLHVALVQTGKYSIRMEQEERYTYGMFEHKIAYIDFGMMAVFKVQPWQFLEITDILQPDQVLALLIFIIGVNS